MIHVTEADFGDASMSSVPSRQKAATTVVPLAAGRTARGAREKFREVWDNPVRLEIACKLIPAASIKDLRFFDDCGGGTTRELCTIYNVCPTTMDGHEQLMMVIKYTDVGKLAKVSELLRNSTSSATKKLMKEPSSHTLGNLLRTLKS